MLKIAHRGASGYELENTLKAFQKAIELKVDMIELDIHQYQDQLVVTHEEPAQKREFPPLLLEDVIDFAGGKVQLDIEIKEGGERYPGIENKLVSFLERKNFIAESLVSCFNRTTMSKIKQLNPLVACGLIFDRRAAAQLQAAVEIGMNVVCPRWSVCTSDLVNQAHQRKIKVFVWVVNTPGQIQYFKKLGVDGIMSDYPDIF